MLQIDHVYEFFYNTLFKNINSLYLPNGCFPSDSVIFQEEQLHVFNETECKHKVFFHDQEPFLIDISMPILNNLLHGSNDIATNEILVNDIKKFVIVHNILPVEIINDSIQFDSECRRFLANQTLIFNLALIVSEKSPLVDQVLKDKTIASLYYFFHGFAALDWYRGFYALNYNKQVAGNYKYDYITFNRLVANDRSYRCYFVSKLAEELLLEHGQISFGLATEQATWQEEIADSNTKLSNKAIDHIKLHLPSTPLIIDNERIPGSASASIPSCVNDSFWHIVTETVFYYDKLHLTEKIFKPIVSKQPFMLLGAPGNLAYLKSYGFKTFDGIIDESYDNIKDNDQRIEAVVRQIAWYCALTAEEKQQVIEAIAPIVEYNFHHFYGEFKHIITRELLDNCKTLFKEIGYDDNAVAYDDIYKTLVN
jgi:hypothetical protein